MKKLLLVALLLPVFGMAQTRLENDTLYMDGVKFYKGQDLNFGIGSNNDKSFNFVFTNPNSLVAPGLKLSSQWATMKMVIHDFKNSTTKKRGEKFYIILSGGNLVKYYCDIKPALLTKEVLTPTVNSL